jgi:PPOX class probable F420-dependent enzyme
MSATMNREEREQFLTEVHVAVISVASQDGGAPLAVPVWYSYQPGGTVNVITADSTRKAAAIRAAGRFSLCAQDERPPYKYVSVEGPAVIEPASLDDRVALARRYLGTEGGDAFIAANSGGADESVVIRLTPERWLTADYSKDQG